MVIISILSMSILCFWCIGNYFSIYVRKRHLFNGLKLRINIKVGYNFLFFRLDSMYCTLYKFHDGYMNDCLIISMTWIVMFWQLLECFIYEFNGELYFELHTLYYDMIRVFEFKYKGRIWGRVGLWFITHMATWFL